MLMSKSAYAKHRGVSRQTVYDWVAKGEVLMSGNKIDAAATESRKKNYAKAEPSDMGRERALEMTWTELWELIKANDNVEPFPEDEGHIIERVRAAVDEIYWDVEFIDDGGIRLDDGDAEYFFTQYDLKENALVAIHALRREICYTLDRIRSGKLIDDVSLWSSAGLKALTLPLENFD
ncbi:hypothetical protein KSU19_19930 [Enterobacter quasiroggenkampii]|uniref:hypothetical protein n=1 Tax=Enterobacter quasiroggenkampii TaxID=2497436 RepID=UPI0021D204A0|nr:hypothetical protein [Enterobacter quasiroggenkampii]MCU6329925.1 hypothetical protein [Enterobacter quasiroggenkampii]